MLGEAIITSGVIWNLYDWLNNSYYFSALMYALSIDIMHGRGLSNEICPQLWPKKTKVRLY